MPRLNISKTFVNIFFEHSKLFGLLQKKRDSRFAQLLWEKIQRLSGFFGRAFHVSS